MRVLVLSILIASVQARAWAAEIEMVFPSGSTNSEIWDNDPDIRLRRAILHDVMGRTTLKWTLRPVVGTRAIEELKTVGSVCHGQITRTTAEELGEPFFPLYETQYVLLAKPGRHFEVKRLEDAKSFSVGASLGSRAQKYLEAAGVPAQLVPRDMMNFQKLTLGRLDLWLTTDDTLKILPAGASRPEVVLRYEKMDIGIACNPAVGTGDLKQIELAAASFRRDHAEDWWKIN